MNPEKKRASGRRPKKYRFHGNQFTRKTSEMSSVLTSESDGVISHNISDSQAVENSVLYPRDTNVIKECASRRKLGKNEALSATQDSEFEGNLIIDKRIFFSFLEQNVSCKGCSGSVKITDKHLIGLSSSISIACEECNKEVSCRNSKLLGSKKNIPEINRRIIYAMRCIGRGLAPLKTFCSIMDLYKPVSQKAYDKISQKINSASKAVATDSMKSAAKEEVEANNDSTDITVSGDGTWKTRGHTSQVGVCTVIGSDTGKVLDVEIMSSACKGCESWTGPRSGVAFEEWSAVHANSCSKNHFGSAGKMEADGMTRIFKRSLSERGVRYMRYVGDGDSKTHLSILEAKPYGEDAVLKLECVSHVQKRMGTRLRKLKKEYASKKLADNKGISGKGRLTDAVINQLSTYYGNAIRQHSNSVKEMREAIWAIYFHFRSTNEEPLHSFCPKDETTWCKYQKAAINGTVDSFQHKKNLPPAVMDAIKPVFNALSHPTLLNRCIGAFTQNANESFHSMIWQLCPKTSGCGRRIAEIAVYEALLQFNEGSSGKLQVMKKLDLQVGHHAISAQVQADSQRITCADKRASLNTIDARRAKRMKKMSVEVKHIQKEGNTYEPGAF